MLASREWPAHTDAFFFYLTVSVEQGYPYSGVINRFFELNTSI